MIRLEAIAPELADRLRRAPAATQRAAGLAATEFAVLRTGVNYPLVKEALVELRAGTGLTAARKAQLDALAGRLDEEYFDLHEAAEKGRANADDYLRAFGQARAVAALSAAGNEDSFEASAEAIYEAAATTELIKELFVVVTSVLE